MEVDRKSLLSAWRIVREGFGWRDPWILDVSYVKVHACARRVAQYRGDRVEGKCSTTRHESDRSDDELVSENIGKEGDGEQGRKGSKRPGETYSEQPD